MQDCIFTEKQISISSYVKTGCIIPVKIVRAVIRRQGPDGMHGNVTKENIENLVSIGVDYISSGALPHSAPIMGLCLKNLHGLISKQM